MFPDHRPITAPEEGNVPSSRTGSKFCVSPDLFMAHSSLSLGGVHVRPGWLSVGNRTRGPSDTLVSRASPSSLWLSLCLWPIVSIGQLCLLANCVYWPIVSIGQLCLWPIVFMVSCVLLLNVFVTHATACGVGDGDDTSYRVGPGGN